MESTGRRDKPFAKRSFGQNFLVDRSVVTRIVTALDLRDDDVVVEIGPGRGALTERLVERAGRVVAIELDREMVEILTDRFAGTANFELISGDIIKMDLSALAKDGERVKVAANLPYYISTAVLQRLIKFRGSISEMVLMFQREVADRITAQPGSSERGFLTVLVEAFLCVRKLFDVPPEAFRPRPKVWSTVIKAEPRTDDRESAGNEHYFERLVAAGFRQKRKTILNNLKASAASLNSTDPAELLSKARIDGKRRAETLTLDEWKELFSQFYPR